MKQNIAAFLFSILALLGFTQHSLALDTEHNLISGGMTRTYFVHTPPSYQSAGEKLPLAIVMHGGGGTADSVIRASAMNDIADRYGFIVVYPEGIGVGPRDRFHTWNAGHCCGAAVKQNVDDVGFISKLIDTMAEIYNIDAKRVYAAGHSNGAQMSYRLACDLSDKIAAIAPNASQGVFTTCKQSRPVPILHFHGTEDKCAFYDGGKECGGCFADIMRSIGIPVPRNTWACEPVPATLAARAKANGCSDKTDVILEQGSVVCERWQNCPPEAEVTLCTMNGSGHVWAGPGDNDPEFCTKRPEGRLCANWQAATGSENHDIYASDLMWQFFSQYALP